MYLCVVFQFVSVCFVRCRVFVEMRLTADISKMSQVITQRESFSQQLHHHSEYVLLTAAGNSISLRSVPVSYVKHKFIIIHLLPLLLFGTRHQIVKLPEYRWRWLLNCFDFATTSSFTVCHQFFLTLVLSLSLALVCLLYFTRKFCKKLSIELQRITIRFFIQFSGVLTLNSQLNLTFAPCLHTVLCS